MPELLKLFLGGLAGAAVFEAFGRPPSAKTVFPVLGTVPTITAGTGPGLLNNLFGRFGFGS